MKQKIISAALALLLCASLAVPALAADKTVTDGDGYESLTVTNVVKQTTYNYDGETCPVFWVPDTGTKVTFNIPENVLMYSEDRIPIRLDAWQLDNNAVVKYEVEWEARNQLRDDGTYNVEFWLEEAEREYPEFYDEQHLNAITYAYYNGGGSRTTILLGFVKAETTPAPPAPALTAKPTSSTVLVNGETVAFDAYGIDGNNYFKLRDLAFVLNGTEKQFEVGYDGATKAIALTSGQAYTPAGGEMASKGSGSKTPTPTTSKITLDGEEIALTAYGIDDNNYFKLRDIGAAFDFGVTWDAAKNTIVIDTSIGYTPE
jgi:hypothetical protein